MSEIVKIKVTVDYYIDNLIDSDSFSEFYNENPYECYKDTSDNFSDHPLNFTNNYKIKSIEVIE
jgi:hypothetical protein